MLLSFKSSILDRWDWMWIRLHVEAEWCRTISIIEPLYLSQTSSISHQHILISPLSNLNSLSCYIKLLSQFKIQFLSYFLVKTLILDPFPNPSPFYFYFFWKKIFIKKRKRSDQRKKGKEKKRKKKRREPRKKRHLKKYQNKRLAKFLIFNNIYLPFPEPSSSL